MSDTKKSIKPKIYPTEERRSPDEWNSRLGLYALTRKIGNSPRHKIPCWQHAAAGALHGWGQHQHDANEPIQLTEDDYKKALAAVDPPEDVRLPAGHTLKPHKPALSQFCRHFDKD